MSEKVYLCESSEVKEGILGSFDVEDVKLMATRHGGKVFVASRICTHKTFDLTKGHYSDGYVTCTLHTSTFDIEDGEALNPPATEALDIYEVSEEEGKTYIILPE